MASGVNVKMGVSGVAQFKQSMNQAKQAVKTLDAQLALNEKQFKIGRASCRERVCLSV